MQKQEQIYPKSTIPFTPVSSLPYVVDNRPEYKALRNSFFFAHNVGPGWISYDPYKVTMLTTNQIFNAVYPTPNVLNIEKQTIKVTNQQELRQLEFMFTKPAMICATRRQTDELGLHGFDTDFVLVLNPLDPLIARHFQTIKNYVQKKIAEERKFFITIDFSHVLDEISPLNFKRYVSWFDTKFHVTNHCRPNSVLSLDSIVICCTLTPLSLLASLPYRIYRKCACVDKTFQFDVRLSLNHCDLSPLILHFFNEYVPPTGPRRSKCRNRIFNRVCSSEELRILLYLKS